MGCRLTGPRGIQRLAPLMDGVRGDRVSRSRNRERKMAGYCNL